MIPRVMMSVKGASTYDEKDDDLSSKIAYDGNMSYPNWFMALKNQYEMD